jgi:cell division inhibitor SepF
MANSWRKAMTYLGLGPDEDYEDSDASYDEAPQPEPARTARPARPPRPTPPASNGATRTRPSAVASPAPSAYNPPEASEPPAVRTLPVQSDDSPKPRVRPVPRTPQVKPHHVSPTSFNQAQEVADKFKAAQPVVLDLAGVDRDLSRRLIDFSSGMCYGLGGHMEKVANHVYLLTPTGVEVPADERRRLAGPSSGS